MKWLVAGISALALASSGGVMAQGNGNGNGKGNGGNAAHAGGGKPDRGNQDKGNGNANRGGGQADRGGPAMRADNGNRGNGNGNKAAAPQMRSPVDRGNGNGNAQANRGNGNGNGNADVRRVVERQVNKGDRLRDNTRVVYRGDDGRTPIRYVTRQASYGVIDGCPPGLAKKRNGCNPPGQVKDRRYFSRYQPDWWGLRGLNRGNYYYDDGYLVRYDGGRIGSYLPLLGGALSIGNTWPTSYRYDPLPQYYSNYYGLGQPDYYRYANNVVYRVDPETAAITSIAALLTGDNIQVGQRMPMGYDVYNVPYGYRDRYYDTPDAYYRYSDGYVYQVDPTTQLVAAAIQLLT